jgi:membrane protein YdbS with pleckstrin-like domain
MTAMNVVRIVITAFVVVLIAVAASGWLWAGSHQPAPQAMASRVVLALSVLAGIIGVKAVWAHRG